MYAILAVCSPYAPAPTESPASPSTAALGANGAAGVFTLVAMVVVGYLSAGQWPDRVGQFLLLSLLTLAGAIALGALLTQGLLARLRLFARVSGELAAGNLAQRLPTNSRISEFNHLARSFNQMADQLQQSFQRMQTTLTESETKFTTIFRTSPDPMAIATRAEGRLLDVNHSLLEFFGYARDEMVGRTAIELNLWADLSQRHRYRALLEQQGRVRNLEIQISTKAGEVKTVLLSAEAQALDGQDCLIVTHRDITDRHRAEAALRESQQQLALAQRVAQVGYWEFDVASRGIAWSEMTFRNWGLEPASAAPTYDELLQKLPTEDRDRLTQRLEIAIAEGLAYQVDLRPIHPDGSVHYLDARGEPVFDDQGRVVKLVGVSMDITDRKQVELALQESETRFRQLAEAVQEGFFVYDTETAHYAYVNSAYWEIRGIDPVAAPGPDSEAQWIACIHPDDRDRIIAALERERRGENFDQEYRYITPGGDLRWLRSKAFPLFNEAGQVVRVVGTVENITESKRTEAALRHSEARFRSAFDDAPYGISLVSTSGQFVLANAYYCTLLGYTEAELLALTFKDITHPDDWVEDWAGFQRMMSGAARTYQMEKRYLTKQGESIPVVVNAAVIHDSAGIPLYSVGHVQDIRDRLAIDRMKDEFISVVSHELRTPITAIQGALALLGAGVYANRPEKARRMLDIAITNSDRLVRLVDDILSFERLESGKVQLEKEVCQVATLMYQAIDSVQPLADRSGITLVLVPLNLTLWAAPDGLIQVLTNLLSNAIKFSRPGGTVWVKASTEAVDAAASTASVLFTVQDHGRGIPAEKLEVIFDQFQQVDVSDSRQRGGTGLGLAICKRIVQQHQGRIWAESQLGQGSTFFVQMPLLPEPSHD
ncbi:PAS domain S-box protein [Leptolyngbya sp. CCNP1308]|uniref:PAS domain S-box protein n=1 Tax=Leptolyngbya sp. CCNP1308 TaxID=3110255 RepID=UPI002B21B426|nr:PAS domain S-box protein [Leptolyngbya sp. CCNP1308]MEA5447861.1 PAS domain S-box protein [Leptolyngbya sp. CCNP1308]